MAELLTAENDVAQELRQLAQAYPGDVFGPVTPDEVKQHSSLITRNSAAMGRHFSKTFTKAADEIERLHADCQELIAERDGLTQKVCELITQRQQAQHERDCAVEEVARLNRENNQFREAMHYPMSSEGAEIMRIFDVTITRVVHTRG